MKRNEFVKETKQQLIRRRDALRRALAGDMSLLRSSNHESVGDEIDAAIATEQAELRSQMLNFETRELAQIENALDKIQHGKYGSCENCEGAIAPARLKALPYATECIECARREERGGSGSKHSPINRVAAYRGENERETRADEAFEEIG